MKLDNLFNGDNNTLKSIGNIFSTINNLGGNKKSSNGSRFSKGPARLCNSKVISMEEAYNKIIDGKTLLLDVRTRNEYNIIKIRGAENIPLDKLDSNMIKLEPNKEREILIYCANGCRVKLAVQKLYRLGYNNVIVWEGAGINDFKYIDAIEKNENILSNPNIM